MTAAPPVTAAATRPRACTCVSRHNHLLWIVLAWCTYPAGIVKEVAMMRMLAGHPAAVQLQEVFEDDSSYYLVSLCWPP